MSNNDDDDQHGEPPKDPPLLWFPPTLPGINQVQAVWVVVPEPKPPWHEWVKGIAIHCLSAAIIFAAGWAFVAFFS
jgi:hypothetical protein